MHLLNCNTARKLILISKPGISYLKALGLVLARNVSAKVAASQREYFPTSQKFPCKISCFFKSSVSYYFYYLIILHEIVIEAPKMIDIYDVESKLSTNGDNFVEQKLDNYCDGDESDFGNLLGRTLDSIVRMIVKMMMVMARSQMFN